jgi:hypothetical protein
MVPERAEFQEMDVLQLLLGSTSLRLELVRAIGIGIISIIQQVSPLVQLPFERERARMIVPGTSAYDVDIAERNDLFVTDCHTL